MASQNIQNSTFEFQTCAKVFVFIPKYMLLEENFTFELQYMSPIPQKAPQKKSVDYAEIGLAW